MTHGVLYIIWSPFILILGGFVYSGCACLPTTRTPSRPEEQVRVLQPL